MRIIKSPDVFQKEMRRLKTTGKTLGFVPTMGALHEGHLSLVRQARHENHLVAASIFVNPLQFGPKEDFKKYPRVLARDKRLLKDARADYLFLPSPSAMYSSDSRIKSLGNDGTVVEPAPELVQTLCARYRPGHFSGVTTVVAKLLNIVQPDKVYFGAKDYQQAAILKRMIRDLNFECEFRLAPTVREKDGLAMSSRNIYLTPEERLRAAAISKALFGVREKFCSGERNLTQLKREALKLLGAAVDRVQYFEIVDPDNLSILKVPQAKMVAAAACFVGKTRLIDNVIIRP